jgi:hypothetical protein
LPCNRFYVWRFTILSFRPFINTEPWISICGKMGNKCLDNLMIFHIIVIL